MTGILIFFVEVYSIITFISDLIFCTQRKQIRGLNKLIQIPGIVLHMNYYN